MIKYCITSLMVFAMTLIASSSIFVTNVYAQTTPVNVFNGVCDDPTTQKEAKKSTVCKEKEASDGKNPLFGPDGIITFAINFMSALVAIAAVIMIIYAGIKYMTSGSNPSDVNKAREMILYALVGVAFAVAAQLLVRLFLYNIGK